MKKIWQHLEYTSRRELLQSEYKHYSNAIAYFYKQKTDLYQVLFGRFWIIWYIFEILFITAFTLITFYSWYWLSSYQQKDKSIVIEQTNFIEQCDTLPITWAI